MTLLACYLHGNNTCCPRDMEAGYKERESRVPSHANLRWCLLNNNDSVMHNFLAVTLCHMYVASRERGRGGKRHHLFSYVVLNTLLIYVPGCFVALNHYFLGLQFVKSRANWYLETVILLI